MSGKLKSASPSASLIRKQWKAISNEGKLDMIKMGLTKVYTLLVSAVPTVHGNAGKIEEITESVTPASLTLLTQLLSPSPSCMFADPLTHLLLKHSYDQHHKLPWAISSTLHHFTHKCTQFHSLGFGWKWILIVCFYVNISNTIMM